LFSPKLFHDKLVKCGVTFYTGVPDSLLKNFCYYVDDNVSSENHIIAANEGGALALAMGYHLATEQVPLVYLQNSGLGNLVNPLLSLTDREVYSTPGILLIGWRGEPGVSDEPQHKKQGRVTLELLNTMEVPYSILGNDMSENEVLSVVSSCVESARSESRVRALVVKKDFFETYTPEKRYESEYGLTREKAIQLVASHCGDDLIVATTGLASRELYEYRSKTRKDHSRDFLVVGGMGHANQIALGLALNRPGRRIICLDGDGAIIMHMGAIPLIGTIKPQNLIHIVLNNGAHDSVGGQKTAAFDIELSAIAKSSAYPHVFSSETEEDVLETLLKIDRLKGPIFFEIRVKKGFRSEIGRPKTTPLENKINFMSQLT
jgi:phosphonopyruvate decarboxylase